MDTATVLAHMLVLYLLVGEPLWGKIAYDKLARQPLDHPSARLRFYKLIVAVEWLWIPVIGLIIWLHPATLEELGFRHPEAGLYGWLFTGGIVLLVAAQTIALVVMKDKITNDPKTVQSMQHIWAMLPRTTSDRQWWIVLSWTAGICEEIAYRGFLFFYFMEIWGLSLAATLIISSVLFALAHIYQGVKPAALTGALAILFGGVYALTGSLWIPIILHGILDWRTLFFREMIRKADADDREEAGKPETSTA